MASSVTATEVGPNLTHRIQEVLENYVTGCEVREFFEPQTSTDTSHEQELQRTIDNVLALIQLSSAPVDCFTMVYQFAKDTPAYSRQRFIVNRVLIAAADRNITSLKSTFEYMLSLVKFTLDEPVESEVISYIHSKLKDLDYKAVRDLFKSLLDKMISVPFNMSLLQRRRFEPIQKLFVDIADRKRNHLPAYFVMNELNRLQLTPATDKHVCFALWRIAERFSEVTDSFRPLAEITSIIGRPFLLPVFGHISLSNTSLSWRLDAQKLIYLGKGPLPYSYEYTCPQSYVLYHLFRQPFSREAAVSLLGLRDRTVLPLADIFVMFVCDAVTMCEEQRQRHRLHWTHISQLVAQSIITRTITASRLLQQLKKNLSVLRCTVARDDVMWLLLELVVAANELHKHQQQAAAAQAQQQSSSSSANVEETKLKNEDIQLIIDIYQSMYTGDEVVTFSGDDSLNQARQMAPACLWINICRLRDSSQPLKLPPSIETQKQVIESTLTDEQKLKGLKDNEFMLAVMINSYYTETSRDEVDTLYSIMGSKFDPQDKLSHTTEFLDALVSNARFQAVGKPTLPKLVSQAQARSPNLPILIDTLAKLIASTDPDDSMLRRVLHCMHQISAQVLEYQNSLQNQNQADGSKQQFAVQQTSTASHAGQKHPMLFVLIELCSCRIPVSQWLPDRRLALFQCLGQAMLQLTVNATLFYSLEHCLLRHVSLMSPLELLSSLSRVAQGNQIQAMFPVWLCGHDPSKGSFAPLQPDVRRASVLATARAAVITVAEKEQNDERLMNYFGRDDADLVLCVIWLRLLQRESLYVMLCRIVDKMPMPRLVLNLERLVDYLLAKMNEGSPRPDECAAAVHPMIWQYGLFPIERFVLSMLMHPTTDHELQNALRFIHLLLASPQQPEFQKRLTKLVQMLPVDSNWAQKLRMFYQEHPEPSPGHSFARAGNYGPAWEPTPMPISFLHVGERMIPVVDLLFSRSIEAQMPLDSHFRPLLDLLAPVYKFHQQPVTFVYTTLFYYHAVLANQAMLRREFVLKIFGTKQKRTGSLTQCNLTMLFSSELDSYMQQPAHDFLPTEQYFVSLVERITTATTHQLSLQQQYDVDWRCREFPNAASRALHVGLVELLMIDVRPDTIVESLVTNVVLESIWSASSNGLISTINSVALLITGLPSAYWTHFWLKIHHAIAVELNDEATAASTADMIRPFDQLCNVGADSKAHRLLALAHAVLLHATLALLSEWITFCRTQLLPDVKNETQLLYVIRLVTPFLHRLNHERHTTYVMDLTVMLYEMMRNVDVATGPDKQLYYEDTYCDLLYHLKYAFVGYTVEAETSPIVATLRPSLRRKLRYLLGTPPTAVDQSDQQSQS